MDLGIQGRRALVLAGNRGIGFGIAKALAGEGVAVTMVARDEARLAAAKAEIEQAGGTAATIRHDLGDVAGLDRLAAAAGPVDILVNNTGGPPFSGVGGLPPDHWRQYFEAMVLSVIGLTDRLLPPMRQAKYGRILTVASSSVIQPIPTIGVSNVLRSALVGWSKTLAGEVARDGVTVNMLLPGRIETDRVRASDQDNAARQGVPVETVRARSAAEIPVGRYGTIEEFGAVAAFLCSVQAAYVTGSMIRIDGGAIKSV